MYDFEIRVGEDEDSLENNPICFKQLGLMDTATQRFQCLQTLLGDWVSINKTFGGVSSKLVLSEVLVFGSKYSCMHYTDDRVLEVYMGPSRGRQDPGGHHVGPMNHAIRIDTPIMFKSCHRQNIKIHLTAYLVFCTWLLSTNATLI